MSVTVAMAEEVLCSALHAGLTGQNVKILWPNKGLAEGEVHPREGSDPWVSFHILHEGSDQESLGELGGRTFTREGQVQLQIFVPANSQRGLEEVTALATAAVNAFEGKTLSGVRFYRVGQKTVGLDGSWFQVNVAGDFEFDEIK